MVVTAGGEVRGRQRLSTPTESGPGDIVDQIVVALWGAAADVRGEPGSLARIGIGAPGTVDQATGVVSDTGNLPGWEGSFALGEYGSAPRGPPVGACRYQPRERAGCGPR